MVLPLSGITSLSNQILFSSACRFVLPLSGITSLSNAHDKLSAQLPVLPLSGITSLSNIPVSVRARYVVLPLSGITSLSNELCSLSFITHVLPLSGITSLSNELCSLSFITHVLPLSGITSLSNMWIFVLRFAAFYHYLELHHSQTCGFLYYDSRRFTTIWNYITLKHEFEHILQFGVLPLSGITSLSNMSLSTFFNLGFYHYLELHHSQTIAGYDLSNLWVLPLSGITSLSNILTTEYRYYRVLPLSGITSLSNTQIDLVEDFPVLPLSGITSLSNLKFQSQFAYLLKSSTSKTAITWQCNSDMVKIYSKI